MVTLEDLVARHTAICDFARTLVTARGKEYATTEDTLSTFKSAGHFIGGKGSTSCMNLMATKMSRIREQVLNKRDPSDSIHDLINYTIYLKVLLEEESKETLAFVPTGGIIR